MSKGVKGGQKPLRFNEKVIKKGTSVPFFIRENVFSFIYSCFVSSYFVCKRKGSKFCATDKVFLSFFQEKNFF